MRIVVSGGLGTRVTVACPDCGLRDASTDDVCRPDYDRAHGEGGLGRLWAESMRELSFPS
ncbi:MAG TPA: hypothetical protein VJV79_26915 [Polyangiaceae bacterium]|nr:hypothetical protein [Polyangiaceae bacterium]